MCTIYMIFIQQNGSWKQNQKANDPNYKPREYIESQKRAEDHRNRIRNMMFLKE